MTTIRVGHLSDIHVPELSDLKPKDLIGKRLTGWLNFQLKRRREYRRDVLAAAVQRLAEEQVDLVIVSGDLTNLGYRSELIAARAHLAPLDEAGIPWVAIPGNHDAYVPEARDGRFEELLAGHIGRPTHPDTAQSDTAQSDTAQSDTARPDAARSNAAWPRVIDVGPVTAVLLDSGVPTPPFRAWGRVDDAQLARVDAALADAAARGRRILVAVHHHPSVALHRRDDDHRNLRGAAALRQLCRQHGVRLLIHGHDHRFDARTMHGHPETTIFGVSSGISSRHGDERTAGQLAIHQSHPDGSWTHEVASWNGARFLPLRPVTTLRPEAPEEQPLR